MRLSLQKILRSSFNPTLVRFEPLGKSHGEAAADWFQSHIGPI